MIDIKLGECYLALYLNHCRNVKKFFRGLTILFSSTGVFAWKFWEYYAAFACGAIALIQLLTVLSDQIVRSDDDLGKIAKLRGYYTKYIIKLEELWSHLENESISERDATTQFSKLKSTLGQKIQSLDDAIFINGRMKKAYNEAKAQSEKYLTNRYGKAETEPAEIIA